MSIQNAPPSFHLLAKPTGAICNLDCAYCFFLSKENLYPGSKFRMPDAVLEAFIQQYLAGQQVPEVNIAWQGGEPTLMGLEFFERSAAFAEKHKKPGQRLSYSIQTNGTKIDDAWAAFFKQHNFLVGISIDGPPEIHDQYRKIRGDAAHLSKCAAGWHTCKNTRWTSIFCVRYMLKMAIIPGRYTGFSGMN